MDVYELARLASVRGGKVIFITAPRYKSYKIIALGSRFTFLGFDFM